MRRALLPAALIATSVLIAWGLAASRTTPEPDPNADLRPWVEVVRVVPQPFRLSVRTQGEVLPRMEIDLVAEVSGRVVQVSERLDAGGFFSEGETLLRIDPRDYEAAVAMAEAEVAESHRLVLVEEEEAQLARTELDVLGEREPSPLALREPQLAAARARLAGARAELARAKVDLERTALRAPFDGRVRERRVGIGQFVSAGASVARLYSVDSAEVRLPLSADELAYLDLPLAYDGSSDEGPAPRVRLGAEIAGREWTWEAKIVRTEAALERGTRMLVAVARVEDPYERDRPASERGMPLAAGLFVDAEIGGREFQDVVRLPAAAYRPDRGVMVIDANDRIELREVEVLRRERDQVLIRRGLAAGERVAVTRVDAPIDGMAVRASDRTPPAPAPETAPGPDAS